MTDDLFKAESEEKQTNLLGTTAPAISLRIDIDGMSWLSNVSGYIVIHELETLGLLRKMIDDALIKLGDYILDKPIKVCYAYYR